MNPFDKSLGDVDHRVERKKRNLIDFFKQEREKSIIKNKEVFSLEFIPEKVYYREEYIYWLLEKMGNIDRFRNNLNIWGPVGCGKTLVVKYCIPQLGDIWNKLDINAKIIYVNCNKYNNTSKVLSFIINSLGGKVPERGWDKGTYLDYLLGQIKLLNSLVICLDEVDILLRRKRNKERGYEDLLFSFGDIDKISLICISNVPKWNQFLDGRIKSRLQLEDMNFSSYKEEEIKGIVLQRLELGLKDQQIFSNGEIEYIVKTIYYNRTDIRDVIRYLQIIIDYIDKNNSNEINNFILQKCYNILLEKELFMVINDLPIPLQVMVWLITSLSIKKQPITAKTLNTALNRLVKNSNFKYKRFLREVGLRRTQDYLNDLKDIYQLISYDIKSLGRDGIKSIIIPEFDVEAVNEHYKLNEELNGNINN